MAELNLTAPTGTMKVINLLLRGNSNVMLKRADGGGMERLSNIDRRNVDPATDDFVTIAETAGGIYIERRGWYAKLIPWAQIEDLDVEYVQAESVAAPTDNVTSVAAKAPAAAAQGARR